MDIAPLQSLQQNYARTPDCALLKETSQSTLQGRAVLVGEAIQNNVDHTSLLLAQLEDELMACAPLQDQVKYFQACVQTLLNQLKIQSKPLTSRKISEAIGKLIEELEPQTPGKAAGHP